MLGFETEIEIEARLPAKAKNVTVWALQMHSIDRIDLNNSPTCPSPTP